MCNQISIKLKKGILCGHLISIPFVNIKLKKQIRIIKLVEIVKIEKIIQYE